MNIKHLDYVSRKLSKILRHDPTPLKMSKDGWIEINDILEHFTITMDDLIYIVDTNDKKRFRISDDETQICANQGHSKNIAIKKELPKLTAIQQDIILYHGTDSNASILIKKDGLKSGTRQHVHWTTNIELAKKRAVQKSVWNKCKPILITLNAKHYLNNKGILYLSDNSVYLTPDINNILLNFIDL